MKFNEQQRQAIQFYKGQCGVIAGAGSGKSTVLVNRIKNLIEKHNEKEEDILAISFTNNTAKELKKKLNKMGYKNVNVGTFHNICARILLENNIDAYAKNKNIAEYEIENCFKRIDENVDIKDVKSFISYQKNYLKSYKDEYMPKESKYTEEELRTYYKAYDTLMKNKQAYDFDDWLIECYKIIKKNPYYFKFVLIDEHQDSNLVQNLLLKEFCKKDKNIFCVFDYRQAIYTFRGGNPEYCMNFNKDWKDAMIINLNINYRSTKNIVNKANNFIKKYYGDYTYYNDSIASNKKEGDIHIFTNTDRIEESELIVNKIEDLIKSGENPKDIAVLYRLNSHSSYIEGELKRKNVPYEINNESSFFKRKEINGIMSYLRLIQNSYDDGAFENIFKLRNYPLSFFPNKLLSEIRENAGLHDFSLYESFISMRYNKPYLNKNMKKFKEHINKLKIQKDKNISIERLIDNVISAFKFDEFLKHTYTNEEELEERIQSIDVLKSFIKGNNLENFIKYVYNTQNDKKHNDGIKLMTIHSSKGLEFKNVFIVSIEDTKFPHKKSPIIDEARLFYVGITRAKENLYLSQIGENNKFIEEFKK